MALGEKWIPSTDFEPGAWKGDDWAMFVGFQDDTVRSTYYNNRDVDHIPQQDSATLSGAAAAAARELFGSSHPSGCLVSMCDGSVTMASFEIDPETFRQMGHRDDGGQPKPSRR